MSVYWTPVIGKAVSEFFVIDRFLYGNGRFLGK
jgi:hypothetical protein